MTVLEAPDLPRRLRAARRDRAARARRRAEPDWRPCAAGGLGSILRAWHPTAWTQGVTPTDRRDAGADRRLRLPQRRRGVGAGRPRRLGRLDVRAALRLAERLRVDPRAGAPGRSGSAPLDVSVPAERRYLPGTMILETSWGTPTGWIIVRDVLLIGPWHHARRPVADLPAHADRLRGRAHPAADHPLRVGRGADGRWTASRCSTTAARPCAGRTPATSYHQGAATADGLGRASSR